MLHNQSTMYRELIYLFIIFIYLFAQAHTLHTIRQGLEQDSKAQTCTDTHADTRSNFSLGMLISRNKNKLYKLDGQMSISSDPNR